MPLTGNMPVGVPPRSRSLGYEIMRWAERYIVQPDGEDAGHPWKFTKEQLRFLLWLYAIDDNGRWVYRTAALRRAKGWGKTPLLAAIAIIEFIGPARFSHWAAEGERCYTCGNRPHTGLQKHPVTKRVPLPLVQIAATSLDQTANTRDMIRGMLAESPAEHEYNLDIGKGIVQFKGGRPGRIEPVTSSSRGLEGARPTFVRPRQKRLCRGRTMSSSSATRCTTGLRATRVSTSGRPWTATSRRLRAPAVA
ncbi:hypothetical protein [Streptomyces chattanoogensis]|uniref:hypothetical protein n=1 Tax=Streptomyces chattanoogensis TaxID=66876 RepID=UPI003689A90E